MVYLVAQEINAKNNSGDESKTIVANVPGKNKAIDTIPMPKK